MSQFNSGDNAINPDATSGSELADINNRITNAQISGHSGAARPTYAVLGTVWLDTDEPPEAVPVYFFDGNVDILLYTINTTTGGLTPGFNVGIPSVGGAPPVSPTTGDLWLNSTNQNMYWWTGTAWAIVATPEWVFPAGIHTALSRQNVMIGNFSVGLPAAPVQGEAITVSNSDGTWNGTEVIDGNGNLIEGSGTMSLDQPKTIVLVFDGTEWQLSPLADLSSNRTANLTAGYTCTIDPLGNSGTGAVTPNLTKATIKNLTITGSFTLAAPATAQSGYCEILATNDATGNFAIDISAYTLLSGSYEAAPTRKNLFRISKIGATSFLEIVTVPV